MVEYFSIGWEQAHVGKDGVEAGGKDSIAGINRVAELRHGNHQ